MTAPLGAAPGEAIPGLLVPGLPGPFALPPPPAPAPPSAGTRIPGTRGVVYMAIAAGAAASPVAYVEEWSVSVAQTWIDITGCNSPEKEYTTGTPEVSGDFSGWYDDASSQTYIAARDGIPRSFYLYPDQVDAPGQCFFGLILPDFAVTGGVQAAVTMKCSWRAAGPIELSPSIAGVLQDEAYNDILDEAYGVMS
jgi:hypothetical protein